MITVIIAVFLMTAGEIDITEVKILLGAISVEVMVSFAEFGKVILLVIS